VSAESGWLDCPECGRCVFSSPDGRFFDGDESKCRECGALCRVVADGEDAWIETVENDDA